MDVLFVNARVCTPFELRGAAVLTHAGRVEGLFDHIDPPAEVRVIGCVFSVQLLV